MTTYVPLGELAAEKGFVGGPFGSNLVSHDYRPSGVPVIRGANMGEDGRLHGPFVYVSEEKFKSDLARNTASAGDLVFTQRGTLGQVARLDEGSHPFVISQSQMRLRVDPRKADSRYVLYACQLEEFRQLIDSVAIRTGVPHINLGILRELVIPVAPLPLQRAIAEVLVALDDKIAANRHVAESARALAVTIVSRLAARCAVSDVATQSRSSVNPNTMSDEAVQHYSLPAFDAGAPEVVAPAALMSAKNHLQEPAVLVAKLNPRIPRIWPVPHLGVMPALASPEFVALTPRNTSVGALWGALAHPSFTEKVLTFVAGTTGSHQRVKPEHLLSVSIPDIRQLSSAEDTTVQTLVALTQQVVSENETLAKTRDELLPLLMSGKITVRDAEKRVEGVV